MKFLNNIKKLNYLEVLLFILLVSLIIAVIFKSNKEGFVEETKEFIRKTGNDVFDEFYVKIYDDLVQNDVKNSYEADQILMNGNKEAVILDVGSGTGHHVNLLNKNKNSVIGIDKSPDMIKIAKQKFPKLNFRLGNVLNSMEFPAETFTHISCLYFTIYYIKDKKLFFENCYKWLMPGGILVLHLVNMKKFDPVLPIASPFAIVSPQSYAPKRITESAVKFNTLDYKSDFKLDTSIDSNTCVIEQPNAIFKETFKFKNSKKARINEHKLYMSSQKSILAMARDIGFILLAQEEMVRVQYENNYLYTLQKPS